MTLNERQHMDEYHHKTSPSGWGLLALGLLSFVFGPLTAIPGLILSKRFRPFSPNARVGYFLCWLFLVLSVVVILLYIARVSV